MDWAKDGAGNRNPIVVINKDKSLAPVKLTPKQGSTLTLDASRSYDPDGDSLSFSWWVLPEAGNYPDEVVLTGSNSKRVSLKVPPGSAGKTIHIICEVTDNGEHHLTSYRRIIIPPSN
jgi:hypothetical protein